MKTLLRRSIGYRSLVAQWISFFGKVLLTIQRKKVRSDGFGPPVVSSSTTIQSAFRYISFRECHLPQGIIFSCVLLTAVRGWRVVGIRFICPASRIVISGTNSVRNSSGSWPSGSSQLQLLCPGHLHSRVRERWELCIQTSARIVTLIVS
jgi:hypothetical protein